MDLAQYDERFNPETNVSWLIWQGPGYHTRVPNGAHASPTRDNMDYALALLATGEPHRVERAHKVVAAVVGLQDTDATSTTYGIWPWLYEEPLSHMAPPDWNWADFIGIRLAKLLAGYGKFLPAPLSERVHAALGHAGWSIFRRNVGPAYTNIAIMGAAVTLAAGEILGEKRLLEYGRQRLRKMVEHTQFHGEFNEYNSPTYTVTALDEVENILLLVADAQARADARTLQRIAWRTIAEHYHPETGQWAGPHSRSYSDLIGRDRIAELLARPCSCPDDLRGRFERLPDNDYEIRRQLISKGDDEKSFWGTTWFNRDACLGSVNHEITWVQRRPLIGYWNAVDGTPVVFRAQMLHDGVDFATGYVRTAQRGCRALSAFNLVTNSGDFHPSLDKLPKGRFRARDIRVRYSLRGAGVSVRVVGDGVFSLVAGPYQAVIHALPGEFGGKPIRWESAVVGDLATVDAVCHVGDEQEFDVFDRPPMLVAAAIEICATTSDPAPCSPVLSRIAGDRISLRWAVGDGLALDALTGPESWEG